MLTIRQDQFRTLSMEMLVARLRERHPGPSEQRGAEWVREVCRAAVGKAATYGISTSDDLLALAGWMLTIHPHFEYLEDGAWARLILQRPELTGGEKIRMIGSQMEHRALASSLQETVQ